MSVKPTYEELERYGRQADITIENLEQKLAESQREFRAADATIENLLMKLEKLAAENAGLKAAVTQQIELRAEIKKAGRPPHADFWVQSICEAEEKVKRALEETPNTDAFLAEVRAQGVEQLAALAGNECQRYKSVNGRAGWRKWKSIVILCTDFASQLRKGVQS